MTKSSARPAFSSLAGLVLPLVTGLGGGRGPGGRAGLDHRLDPDGNRRDPAPRYPSVLAPILPLARASAPRWRGRRSPGTSVGGVSGDPRASVPEPWVLVASCPPGRRSGAGSRPRAIAGHRSIRRAPSGLLCRRSVRAAGRKSPPHPTGPLSRAPYRAGAPRLGAVEGSRRAAPHQVREGHGYGAQLRPRRAHGRFRRFRRDPRGHWRDRLGCAACGPVGGEFHHLRCGLQPCPKCDASSPARLATERDPTDAPARRPTRGGALSPRWRDGHRALLGFSPRARVPWLRLFLSKARNEKPGGARGGHPQQAGRRRPAAARSPAGRQIEPAGAIEVTRTPRSAGSRPRST